MAYGPSPIIPFLYLGNLYDSRDRAHLRKLAVSSILNVSDSARFDEEPDMRLHHVPISDFGDSNLLELIPRCSEIIAAARDERRPILVHCRHGQNRSPAVVLAYLIEREHMTLRDAHRLVSTARPMIAVHESYFAQLQSLERTHTGRVTLEQSEIGPSVQELIRDLRREAKKDQ